MTTRKELIERIQAMQLGTQEMLDAAANDATLIPFDTLFADEDGNLGARTRDHPGRDDAHSVLIEGFGIGDYYSAWQLRPAT